MDQSQGQSGVKALTAEQGKIPAIPHLQERVAAARQDLTDEIHILIDRLKPVLVQHDTATDNTPTPAVLGGSPVALTLSTEWQELLRLTELVREVRGNLEI